MFQFRSFVRVAVATALLLCLPVVVRCDEFVVIARDLKAQAFPAGTVIKLRVFKQLRATSTTPGAIRAGSLFVRGELLVDVPPITLKDAAFVADIPFKIDVDDERLTGREENPDRTILLELSRNDANTAIVPFVAVGEVNKVTGETKNFGVRQTLNVAVPESRPEDEFPCYEYAPCYEYIPCYQHHPRSRRFRR